MEASDKNTGKDKIQAGTAGSDIEKEQTERYRSEFQRQTTGYRPRSDHSCIQMR